MTARLRGFAISLALIALGAAMIRLVHVLAIAPDTAGVQDGFWFQQVSYNVASGDGFDVPAGSFQAGSFHLEATAEHPPLYVLALAAGRLVGLSTDEGLRALGTLFGTIAVVGVGLLGRRVGGDRVGLVAAALAAVSPLLIAADGALLSETLYGPLIAFTLLAAWRLGERPSLGRAAVAGVLVGLAALTRSEAVFLVPLMVLPLAWRGGRDRRWLRLATPCAVVAIVLAPWVIRNWSVFGEPILTNNQGDLIAVTNCHASYYGRDVGYQDQATCIPPTHGDEAERAAQYRRAGLNYAGDHLGRLPVVVAVRLLRTWTLYQPYRTATEQGRSANVQKLGITYDFFVIALAIGGLVLLRRRRAPLLVLVAPLVLVSLSTMASFGTVRLRHAAEIPLLVLAAVALVAVFDRLIASRSSAVPARPLPGPAQ